MTLLSLLAAFLVVLSLNEYIRIRQYIRRIEKLDRAAMQKNEPVQF